MKQVTITSKSGAEINLRCEHRITTFRYIAEIPKANIILRQDFPWGWGEEQGQKILVLGYRGPERMATTVDAETENKINDFIDECQQWEQDEKIKRYQPLIDQLPERKFETDGNDKKTQELLQRAAEIKDIPGAEMDGVNLQQSMRRQALRQEAIKHCNHNLKTTYQYGHTGDVRLKITREITCEKCGLVAIDEASEELSDEAMWN